MIHVRHHAGRDWWRCSKCSVEIDLPAAPREGLSPGLAGGQDAFSAGHATIGPFPPLAVPGGDFRDA